MFTQCSSRDVSIYSPLALDAGVIQNKLSNKVIHIHNRSYLNCIMNILFKAFIVYTPVYNYTDKWHIRGYLTRMQWCNIRLTIQKRHLFLNISSLECKSRCYTEHLCRLPKIHLHTAGWTWSVYKMQSFIYSLSKIYACNFDQRWSMVNCYLWRKITTLRLFIWQSLTKKFFRTLSKPVKDEAINFRTASVELWRAEVPHSTSRSQLKMLKSAWGES
jgi:hypothetical protein